VYVNECLYETDCNALVLLQHTAAHPELVIWGVSLILLFYSLAVIWMISGITGIVQRKQNWCCEPRHL